MNKLVYLLIIILMFIENTNAQFIGYYNLRDGGVDMPSSQLYVLPNNEFIIFSYAGYRNGKWEEIDKNNIILTEVKTMNSPFIIYGYESESEKTRINVYGLSNANAFINFSKDTISNNKFQPIFNIGANCFADDYNIDKKNGEFNWLTLTVAKNPEIGKRLAYKYPYKAISYIFPMDKKYSRYTIFYNKDATVENFKIVLTKNKKFYRIFGEEKLEREDLTDEILKGIENGRKAVDNEYDFSRYGIPISFVSNLETIIHEPVIKPIFISTCKDDENESKIEKQILPSVERSNGFYTVLNFKKDEYDVTKYKLSKEPSITKDDISLVNKVISDNGGFEIEIIFTEKGTRKFAELSKNNIGKPIVIVINKLIVFYPRIISEIEGGRIFILGDFSESEIDEFISNLKNSYD